MARSLPTRRQPNARLLYGAPVRHAPAWRAARTPTSSAGIVYGDAHRIESIGSATPAKWWAAAVVFGDAASAVSLIAGQGATLGLAAAVMLARLPRGGVVVNESWTRAESAGRSRQCHTLLPEGGG